MQITNASVPFPNAVAPFSPKVDQPSSGVTKDILASSFAPLNETQTVSASQNSLSERNVVYSPESLVQSVGEAGQEPVTGVAPQTIGNAPEPSTSGAVSLSPEGSGSRASDEGSNEAATGTVNGDAAPDAEQGDVSGANSTPGSSSSTEEGTSEQPDSFGGLTPEEQEIVSELAARDREVRTHEQQHQAVGGQYAGSASYSYQVGPDGVQYAIGGEVSIDISEVPNNPQATIDKMRIVQSAALAPAEPSAQDRSVASTASRIILQAQAELASQRSEELQASRDEVQQRQIEAAEAREQQQERQDDARTSVSEGVRTYESLVELGQQFENGLTPAVNLDEVV
ncbi:putative metalloprotease CJM1_0395 family protein [Alkalimarinus coralli]|uniref:putative metalloprotease CJM1_0395 family protein n=1 Tax=Alkalimarinus coralli TaxID=2935863 RepID=UPI00202B72AE|nr:putative metalloprotease CJM1_0395 family protein [Alkalimarinus coralli]